MGKKKRNSGSQVVARGIRKNRESGDPLLAVSDTLGVPGQETQLLLSGPSSLRRGEGESGQWSLNTSLWSAQIPGAIP